jgi:hypothetical protein
MVGAFLLGLGSCNGNNHYMKKYLKQIDVFVVSWLAQFTSDPDLLRPRIKPDCRNDIDSFIRELRI